jgi:hypothetical protein
VHQLQYQSSQKLLQEFDRYAASAPHRHMRPHCRPNSGMGWILAAYRRSSTLQQTICGDNIVAYPPCLAATSFAATSLRQCLRRPSVWVCAVQLRAPGCGGGTPSL